MADAESLFAALAADVRASLREGEDFTLWYSAEASEFIRYNRARVRQAGQVRQAFGRLTLIRDGRHARIGIALCGEPASDRLRLADGLRQLREAIGQLQPDPYLTLEREPWQRRFADGTAPPDGTEVLAQIEEAARGHDLVGIYAAGPLYRGFANSFGAFGWHAAQAFHFDWSLFHANGQAVKADYAGSQWDPAGFASRFEAARRQLEHLGKPPRILPPGDYRAYLAPAALDDVLGMLGWGGFSARALAHKESPLQRLYDGGARLSPLLDLDERASGALAPAFGPEGIPRSDAALVRAGRAAGRLVYPRSAREYGLAANCADAGEGPQALAMGAGTLAQDDVLAALGTGLYIGNLWYLNWSDAPAGRMTGMTRFATFWVEDGRIQAPVGTMRFDDSIYSFLGDHLEALTSERQLRVSSSTYGERQTDSSLLPGALTGRLMLTL
ncbi:metallopeptidase TldD-related protein [Cupriavidus basilensis]|uniref:Metallopeptidase TldD-related protein n=1 Tax=Cupriavidus basilensis TaxID=68895 RepID=A0ABT6AK59_9BURK|nr:metallopeptidase TldD-related protein [Cupriavidus basilensis]MDF3832166.1 metallopeptidase TldD-related protein [Cupriavidus basilensis]